MKSVNENVAKMDHKIDVMEDQVETIQYMCLDLDAKSRRQNLVAHGVLENSQKIRGIHLKHS
jgi:hypothetical protein